MKKIPRVNILYLLSGLLVLATFFTRIFHIAILPIFVDEAIYIRWAQIMKAEETLRFLPLSDGKEPLFMWVVIAFLKFFRDPLVAGRIVSVFSGFGTLLGVSYLSYLFFKSKKVVLVAAIIYSFSPFAFFFDRMALVDSMLSMFGIWTFILSYLSIKKHRFDFAMLAGFTLGGAWLTKSPALFFALMLPAFLLFSDRRKSLVSVFYLLVTVLIGYGFYNILRLGPNFSMIASRNLDYVWPVSHLLVSPFDPLKPFLVASFQWLVLMGPWSLVTLALLGVVVNNKKYWKEYLILGIWFLVPIFVESEYAKVLTARYIFFTLPYLIIIAGSAFLEVRKNWMILLVFVLVLFVAQSSIFDYQLLTAPEKANLPRSERSGYLEEWTAGQGIKDAADYIKKYQKENPDKKIVIGTEGYFGTLPDGLQMYLNNDKQITIIGVGLDFSAIPEPLINSKKFGNKTFLLINDDRFKGDMQKLKIIGKYPKASRPNGTHQTLYLFEI